VGFDYVAVPWPEDVPDPQPAMRRDLEALGFRLLGGCAPTQPGLDDVRDTAPSYGDRAAEFARRAIEPGQVFAAPDGTAYAHLAWLWECRYAMFTTVRADGTLVQTMTEWGADPVWPRRLARFWSTTDRHTEQLVLATDRAAEVVDGVGVAWSAHAARVAAHGVPVPVHTDLHDFVAIWTAESHARSRWTARVQWVAGVLAFLVVLVPFVVTGILLGRQPWWVDAAVIVVAGLLTLSLFLRVWLRVRRWRGLRPAFRAPVPGRHTRTP
jgi:hypothetical protein